MRQHIYRSLWGMEGTIAQQAPNIAAAGYDGIEAPLPPTTEVDLWRRTLAAHDLHYIAMIFTQGMTVAEHLVSFRQQVVAAQALAPDLITSHSGYDGWNEAESLQFCQEASKIAEESAVRVAHETHRGRIFFHPWITQRLIQAVPALQLCADFSHWVCVCERLLADEETMMAQITQHCLHIHARIGYEEGPQVPDPRDPTYSTQVQIHEHWWDLIWQAQAAQGQPVSTLTPEFGPPPYQQTLPYTAMPVSDLVVVCDWQAHRQRQRFAQTFDQPIQHAP